MAAVDLAGALGGLLEEIAEVAGWLWERGWAEANAGNLSIDVTEELGPAAAALSHQATVGRRPERGWRPASAGHGPSAVEAPEDSGSAAASMSGPPVASASQAGSVRDAGLSPPPSAVVSAAPYGPRLAGRWLIVSAAGARCRELARQPTRHLVLFQPVVGGWQCWPVLVWLPEFAAGAGEAGRSPGCAGPGRPVGEPDERQAEPLAMAQLELRPTSELATHLMIHSALREADSAYRAVLHSHPTHLVALSQASRFAAADRMTAVLCSMLPELKLVLPEGVALVPYLAPGSDELARTTAQALGRQRVAVWARHGCVAVASDLRGAFDLVDVVEKAAHMYFLCRSAGIQPIGPGQADASAPAD